MNFIDTVTSYCVTHRYIQYEQKAWLRYALEKKCATLLVTIPMLVIGCVISSLSVTLSFYFSFVFLRCRTNGVHAKTLAGCFSWSLLCEVILFRSILPQLTPFNSIVVVLVAGLVVFLLAPVNHISLHLSNEELVACKKSARIRVLMLLCGNVAMILYNYNQIAYGITMGILLTAFLLIIARCV